MRPHPAPLVPVVASMLALAACSGSELVQTESRAAVEPAAFGRLWVGDAGTATLLVRSTGSGWFRVLSVAVDDPAVQVAFAPAAGGEPVAPGGSLPVPLKWSPDAVATLAATATVVTDLDGAPPFTVRITGEARAEPSCDDGNPCTDDRFERAGERCLHADHDRACDDGSACTVEDRCVLGACRGVARTCDDGDTCTLDLCDPAAGCVFPPDGRVCDDGDPCTANVCDRTRGCSFPDAPAGTMCGPFSCATANVCVLGRCRALDVRGTSDGIECFDGDLCTEGDACLDGACAPGLRIDAEPRVVARLPTFGGRGSKAASDGVRYLFTGDRVVHVVDSDGGALTLRSSLPLVADVAPVVVAPGRFLVAGAGALSLVDATDVHAPRVAWTRTLVEAIPVLPENKPVLALARVTGGVVVVLRTDPAVQGGEAFFVAIDPSASAPGAARRLPTDQPVEKLEADGRQIAYLGPQGARVLELDDSSPRSIDFSTTRPTAIAVSGNRLGLLVEGRILVLEQGVGDARPVQCAASSPDCVLLGASCTPDVVSLRGRYQRCPAGGCAPGAECRIVKADPCPDCEVECPAEDNACCRAEAEVSLCVEPGAYWTSRLRATLHAPSARDFALDGQLVTWVTPTFVASARVAADGTIRPGGPVDRFGFDEIATSPSGFIASGPLALPFVREVGAGVNDQRWQRLTGTGHGDVSAVTDAPAPRVMVGGATATGEVDLLAKAFSRWRLLPPTDGTEPRLLRGTTRTVVIDDLAPTDGGVGSPCSGNAIRIVRDDGFEEIHAPCGLHASRLEVSGGRLWAATLERPADDGPLPAVVGRGWPLDALDVEPTVTVPLALLPPASWNVRGADRAQEIAFSHVVPAATGAGREELTIRIRPSDSDSNALHAIRTLPVRGLLGAMPRELLAFDGDQILVGDRDGVRLSPRSESSARGDLTLALAGRPSDDAPPRVLWMANGRAWIAWQRSDTGQQLFSEARYDGAAWTLDELGRVELGGPALRAYDTGVYTVATTPGAVSIVSPACRQ